MMKTRQKRIKECISSKKVLTFGATMTIGEYAILPSIVDLIRSHPNTGFHIRYRNTKTFYLDLYEGNIDFAIVEGCFKEENHKLVYIVQKKHIAVASSQHVFTKPIHCMKDISSEWNTNSSSRNCDKLQVRSIQRSKITYTGIFIECCLGNM